MKRHLIQFAGFVAILTCLAFAAVGVMVMLGSAFFDARPTVWIAMQHVGLFLLGAAMIFSGMKTAMFLMHKFFPIL